MRIAIYVLVLLILPLAVIWIWVAQPMTSHGPRSQAQVDPRLLRQHVEKLSVEFYPRSVARKDNLRKTTDYIREHFARSGALVTNDLYMIQNDPYENVIAIFPGATPARIIVGAHYDSYFDTPGADDNASGIAGLLALASLLGKIKTHHSVELVAYCTEEPPYFRTDDMGSARHAKRLYDEGVQIRAMLALEMIGYFNPAPDSQSYLLPFFRFIYPSRGDFIALIGNTRQRPLLKKVKQAMRGATPLPVHSAALPAWLPGSDLSDHRNYWAHGFPALMITDTAFYRNGQYHLPGDSPDTLDYDRMAQVVIGTYEAILALDQQSQVSR